MKLKDENNQKLLEVLMTRKNIRNLKEGDDISLDDIKKIVYAGIMAPSPSDSQPWRFHIVSGETKQKFIEKLKKVETVPPLFRQLVCKHIEEVTKSYN